MKTVVMLQGGAAFGAFTAGVWCELAPRLVAHGASVIGLGGTSVGAVQAAVIARHAHRPDLGARALEQLWRERIATPSFPFAGPLSWFSPRARSWNGLLTSLLIGNRALHQPNPWGWLPGASTQRASRPLLDRQRMRTLLETVAPPYCSGVGGGADAAMAPGERPRTARPPLLAVGAVDVQSGALQVFDSDTAPLTALHLHASSALPVLYAPVAIDGRVYWDGDLSRDSVLPHLLERLVASGRLAPSDVADDQTADPTADQTAADAADDTAADPVLLVTIECRARRTDPPPQSTLGIGLHILDLLMSGKLDGPERRAAGIGHALHIVRDGMANDDASRELDYSPERIDALIAQGRRQAAEAWKALQLPAPARTAAAVPAPADGAAPRIAARA